MRVMLDTNILVSTFIFKGKPLCDMVKRIADNYSLVLCSYVIDELHDVVGRKFADKVKALEQFLLELPFEYIYTPQMVPADMVVIRDKDDEKVLYSAILSDVDVLITGDKDFKEVEIDRPEVLTPHEFLQKY